MKSYPPLLVVFVIFCLPMIADGYSSPVCQISCWTKECYAGCVDVRYGKDILCNRSTVLQFYQLFEMNNQEQPEDTENESSNQSKNAKKPMNTLSRKDRHSDQSVTLGKGLLPQESECIYQCINIQFPPNDFQSKVYINHRALRGCIPANSSVTDISLRQFHSALDSMNATYWECGTSRCNINNIQEPEFDLKSFTSQLCPSLEICIAVIAIAVASLIAFAIFFYLFSLRKRRRDSRNKYNSRIHQQQAEQLSMDKSLNMAGD